MNTELLDRTLACMVFALVSGCSHIAAADGSGEPGAAIAEAGAPKLQPAIQVAGRPPITWTLAERMDHHKVPGVSIAVIEGGRIRWANGFGMREAGTDAPVTNTTAFQAGSVSKVVAATVALRLVDKRVLSLDADVNEYLKSWKVPENAYTSSEKVTLRRILSHSAGLTVHGFEGYKITEPTPSILQVLDGLAPAKNQPVRVDVVPGSISRYSGGGTTVMQLALTDVTGRPFPVLAQDLVFEPSGMTSSTYQQPLPGAFRDRAARGHTIEGKVMEGGWVIGPEMAAGWLWTTPTDLAKWAIAVDRSYEGKSAALLSKSTAREMLTDQKGGYGLGPLLEGSGRSFRFGHGGNNPGFRAQVTYFPETDQGAVVMVNGDGGDPLIDKIMRGLAVDNGWPALTPKQISPASLQPAQIARVLGRYQLMLPGAGSSITATVRRGGDRLLFDAPPVIQSDEIVATSPTEFLSLAWGFRITFDSAQPGPSKGFALLYGGTEMAATREP